MRKKERTDVRSPVRLEDEGFDIEYLQPQSLEAEAALLGCLALSREAMPEIEGLITPAHFCREINARLFKIMQRIYQGEAQQADPHAIREELAVEGLLIEPEEAQYLDSLVRSEPSAHNIRYYADIVHERYLRRRVIDIANIVISLARDLKVPVPSLYCHALVGMERIMERVLPSELDVLSYADLIEGEVPEVEWIVDRLVPRGGITMIAGDPGTGKSWVCYHLAQCVASGEHFLGEFFTNQTGVLILDMEGTGNLIRRRLMKLHKGMGLLSDLRISVLAEITRLDDMQAEKALITEIRRLSAGLVILDPLVMAHELDENSSSEMGKVFAVLRRIQGETGCTFFVVHHARKQSMASNLASQRLRGSTAILGFLDSYLFLRQVRPGRMVVEHAKSRHAEPVEDFSIELKDVDKDSTTIMYVGESKDSPDKTQAALDFILRTLAENGGEMGRKEITQRGKGEGMSLTAIERSLRSALDSNQLVKDKDGTRSIYRLPSLQDHLHI